MSFEERTPSLAEEQLLEALGGLGDSTSFCANGQRPLVLPGLSVAGVGEIALPVSTRQARQLIKQANQAPYGRGKETLVDTDVRRVWQLEPTQFQLENPKWDALVADVVQSVKTEFAIKQRVAASLYKLLIYEKGSFFVPHRDTEKAHRMFATLVICLPSKHEGGTLVVSHAGNSQEFDFSGPGSAYDLQYAAFYADCQHEVRPVTDGYRICLVYNLATNGRRKQPAAPEFKSAVESVASAVQSIFLEDDQRDMLVLPLLHQYTEAGLAPDRAAGRSSAEYCDEDWEDDQWHEEIDPDRAETDIAEDLDEDFDKIPSSDEIDSNAPRGNSDASLNTHSSVSPIALDFKGADRARVDVLKQVAAKAKCRAFAALLTHWQSGYPDYGTINYAPHRSRWGYGYEQDVTEGNDEAEFEEVFEESMTLKHWHSLAGEPQPFQVLSIEESDILSDLPAEDWPHEQELHEATGNAGMSMERWYRQAVVVLWPESRHHYVLASQGVRNSVPALKALVESIADPSKSDDCNTFARRILDEWSTRSNQRGDPTESLGTIMTRSLLAINDSVLAALFFERVLPLEYALLEGESLAALAELAGWKSIEQPLISLCRMHNPDDYHANLPALVAAFGALACQGGDFSKTRKSVCRSVLAEVTKTVARWEKSRPSIGSNAFAGVVESFMRGICPIGTQNDLKSLLSRIATKPKLYDLHQVVIPAVDNLAGDAKFVASSKLAASGLRKLRQYCIDQLQQRTDKKPQPPKNWRRSSTVDCDCEDCQELATFLKDKDAKVHRFPRRKDLRHHLHQQIDRHRLDCAHVTERVGRPYTLVCTKNQATYERALEQYTSDCQLLQELSSG